MKDALKRLLAAFGEVNMYLGILTEAAFVLTLIAAGFIVCIILGLL
jgi:hypothetical protein